MAPPSGVFQEKEFRWFCSCSFVYFVENCFFRAQSSNHDVGSSSYASARLSNFHDTWMRVPMPASVCMA